MKALNINELRQDVSKLEDELGELLYEQCNMLIKRKPVLEHEYMKKIGSLEYALYLITIREQRMKRMKEDIQASINISGTYDLAVINADLDREFSDYLTQIKIKAERARQGLLVSWSIDARSSETLQKIKRVFHDLVKKLHPDLNPNQGPDDYMAFLAVQKAYESNDLEALLSWQILYSIRSSDVLSTDELLDRRLVLSSKITAMKDWFIAITNEFPFNVESLLNDEELVREKQEKLEKDYESVEARCQIHIEVILNKLNKEDLHDLDTSWFENDRYREIIENRLEQQ